MSAATRFYKVEVADRAASRRWIPDRLCGQAFAWLTNADLWGYPVPGAKVVDVFEDFGGQMFVHRIPLELITVIEQV